MYVKIFRFRVSNWASSPYSSDKRDPQYYEKLKEIKSPEEISKTINKFISDKSNVSISVNNVDVEYHNNGRGNTVDLIYTILWDNNIIAEG